MNPIIEIKNLEYLNTRPAFTSATMYESVNILGPLQVEITQYNSVCYVVVTLYNIVG